MRRKNRRMMAFTADRLYIVRVEDGKAKASYPLKSVQLAPSDKVNQVRDKVDGRAALPLWSRRGICHRATRSTTMKRKMSLSSCDDTKCALVSNGVVCKALPKQSLFWGAPVRTLLIALPVTCTLVFDLGCQCLVPFGVS